MLFLYQKAFKKNFLSSIPMYGYTITCLSIQLLVGIALFPVLALINKASIDICIQIFVWTLFISIE